MNLSNKDRSSLGLIFEFHSINEWVTHVAFPLWAGVGKVFQIYTWCGHNSRIGVESVGEVPSVFQTGIELGFIRFFKSYLSHHRCVLIQFILKSTGHVCPLDVLDWSLDFTGESQRTVQIVMTPKTDVLFVGSFGWVHPRGTVPLEFSIRSVATIKF